MPSTRWISLAGATLVALCAPLAGCASGHHATMKRAAYTQWNLTRVQIIYQLAHQQYETREYHKCRKTLREAVAMKCPFPPVHILAAKVDIEQGRLQSACQHLNVAMRLDNANPQPYYLMGIIYQRWQNNQAAHDYYADAWKRKPTSALYMLATVEMKIAMGQYVSAQKLLKSQLIYFEESSAVRAALGRLCMIRGSYARASHYYRHALLLSPADDNLKLDLAESYFFDKRYHHARRGLKALRHAKGIPDKSTVLLLLGECYVNLNDSLAAHDCFSTLSAEYPHDEMAWTGLAKASLQINDLIEADIACHKALRVNPKDVHAWIILALVHERRNHWGRATANLLRARALSPKSSTVLCMLGLAAGHQGHKLVATTYFRDAVAANPRDGWARKLLAGAKAGA